MSRSPGVELLAGIVAIIAVSASYAIDQKDIDKAIAAGVKALRSLQTEDDAWPQHRETGDASKIGATALAGLTLLECGAKADDEAVLRAAHAVRLASPALSYNYSICLAILFFDRLGDPCDIPLIESLTVRLLAGQTSNGGWSYRCPPVPDAEVRRLQAKLAERKELVGRREPIKPGGVKRSVKDLPKEIQQQLAQLKRTSGMAFEAPSDNSNTQFATLALWVARRYGLPVEEALKRVGTHFRNSQHAEGGWGYRDPGMRARDPLTRSTASMTCAGLLGLAVADGELAEKVREHQPGARTARETNKNHPVRKGLLALSAAIGEPSAANGRLVGGRTYYFLWSLERVAVALDLKTIGKKHWYIWGAEILLANQQDDGSWSGSYGECGADTCFALLFLKRANLVPDLTQQLAGRIQDPGERVLKGSEGIALAKNDALQSGIEDKNTKPNKGGQNPTEIDKKQSSPSSDKKQPAPPAADKPQPKKSAADDPALSPTAGMAAELARSRGTGFERLLHNFKLEKGAEFTEALALAIPQLSGERQRRVRDELAKRLTRMKDSTLKSYLSDENLEIRIAATRASVLKGSKALIPDLIPLVRETRGGVAEAAHQALKELSGQDFGPKIGASREERVRAAQQWSEWWSKQQAKK